MQSTLVELRSAISLARTDAVPVLSDSDACLAADSAPFASCGTALSQLGRSAEAFLYEPETLQAVGLKHEERSDRQRKLFKLHYWCLRIKESARFLPQIARTCANPGKLQPHERLNAKQQCSATAINIQSYLTAAERALALIEG